MVALTEYRIQGAKFANTFKLIKLKSYDIILGADWIFEHSPICLDLKQRTLGITHKGKNVTFQDHTIPRRPLVIDHQKLQKMIHKKVMGYFIQV